MDVKSPTQVIIFGIIFGVVLWLCLSLFHAFFIVSVPQEDNYCEKWIPIPEDIDAKEKLAGSSVACVQFISTLERLKYHHNLNMVERNRYVLYEVHTIAVLVSLMVFYLVPNLRERLIISGQTAIVGALIIGFVVGFVPYVLGGIMPAPSKWMPRALIESAENRRLEIHIRLTELAHSIDQQEQE